MFSLQQAVSYEEMCREEGLRLEQGMVFRPDPNHSIILMSQRKRARYRDNLLADGRTLIYEGHDAARNTVATDPTKTDQPFTTLRGRPTQNALFHEAALRAKRGEHAPEKVRAYDKIRIALWAYNGVFDLLDSWTEQVDGRRVFKFQLSLSSEQATSVNSVNREDDLIQRRFIPSSVKQEVWKRDKARCVICGASDNLHFDHDLPYVLGGSSLLGANIRLLCARHNLEKGSKIQ